MTAAATLCVSCPLKVDVYCMGGLGCMLRAAQRAATAQPHAGREEAAARLLKDGVMVAMDAFVLAVPQARAHRLPAVQSSLQGLAVGAALSNVPRTAQVLEVHKLLADEVSRTSRIKLFLSSFAAAPCKPAFCNTPAIMAHWHSQIERISALRVPGNQWTLLLERVAAAVARAEALPHDALRSANPRERSMEDLRLEQPELVVGCWASG